MICQDECKGNEATNLIYDRDKGQWFFVCDECLKEDDLVCPYKLTKIVELMTE